MPSCDMVNATGFPFERDPFERGFEREGVRGTRTRPIADSAASVTTISTSDFATRRNPCRVAFLEQTRNPQASLRATRRSGGDPPGRAPHLPGGWRNLAA